MANNRLFYSVKRARALETIPALIKLGANPYEIDDKGRTLLHYAAERGEAKLVDYLLNTIKIKPNIADCDGETALHFAAWQRHVCIMKALIRGGGDVNASDKLGMRPLHIAAIRGHLPMVSTLIKCGADIFATSFPSRGYARLTAREAAIFANQSEMARVLGIMEKKKLAKMERQTVQASDETETVAIVICSHGTGKTTVHTKENQNKRA